jgi:hypothetical protein
MLCLKLAQAQTRGNAALSLGTALDDIDLCDNTAAIQDHVLRRWNHLSSGGDLSRLDRQGRPFPDACYSNSFGRPGSTIIRLQMLCRYVLRQAESLMTLY